MYQETVKKLILRKLTISTAESITGGLISKMITDVSGSSEILKESYVVYSNDAKITILGVDAGLIEKYGVVSREVAKDMAVKLKMITGKDICVSVTGNAGPNVCDDKPVGRVYVGIDFLDDVNVYELTLDGSREEIRDKTANFVFDKIEELL
ncbi:MAG: CinA family protein [Lachnospiraceae bacterium]|nr:CinA family protein [Lachnospiraceae bacterium]